MHYHKVCWFSPLFGMAVLEVTNALSATTAINYAVDSYKDLDDEAVIEIIRSETRRAARSYDINSWIENTGSQNTFLAAAFISIGCTAVFLWSDEQIQGLI